MTNFNCQLIGDPIDVKMLEMSGFSYVADTSSHFNRDSFEYVSVLQNGSDIIKVMKIFEFHSEF